MGVAAEEGDRAVLPHLHSRLTSWLCWLGPSVPEPSRGILASTGGLLFLLRPSPTPSCRDYTHLQLSMRGSLPGRRPAPGHPHAARRTAWQRSWSSLCSSSCCSVYPRPHPGKSLVVFWFLFLDIFSPQGPCLYLQPLGGRRAGGSPDSNRLRVNVRDPWGRSSLGDCWAVREGLRKLACSQVVGGHSRGTTLWRKFGRFYFCSDGQALYSSQSTPGTPAYGKSTGAQSSKCKGSLQQKANQSKGPPLGNCVNNSGASAQ